MKNILLILSFVTISFTISGQENTIDSLISQQLISNRIAGSAVAVLKGGKKIFSGNYGFADTDSRMPVVDSTQFNVMSVSKIFIASSIMKLADEKLIQLNAPVTKYLINLPSFYDQVTVYHLLSHTSGIPDYVHVNNYMIQANRTQTPMELLKSILEKPLDFNPGEKSSYSNSGYILLGLVIEKVTGLSLGKYLKKSIFNPLGMTSTYLDSSVIYSKARAKGYASINGQLKYEMPLDPSQYWAAGGIISTINDMVKWNEGLKKGAFLPENEINLMMQPFKLNNGDPSEFGLGFELMNTPDLKLAGNNGAGVGFNASDIYFLNDSLTIIVLTNTTNSNSTMIVKKIHDILIQNMRDKPQTNKDKLDSLVIEIFRDAKNGITNPKNFTDAGALDKFKVDFLSFLKSQGSLIDGKLMIANHM